MNLDFRIIELQKRGISLISLGKMTEFWFFFFPKKGICQFFSPFPYSIYGVSGYRRTRKTNLEDQVKANRNQRINFKFLKIINLIVHTLIKFVQLGFAHSKVKKIKWAWLCDTQLIYIFYTRIINEILLLATNDKNKIEVIKIMENKRKKKRL